MTTVDEAVQHALDNITDCQVAIHLLKEVRRFINDSDLDNEFNTINNKLHDKLDKAWSRLSWFGTVDMTAKKALHERAKSWFAQNDTDIMSFLGCEGNYYVHDREAFLKNLRMAFGIWDD